MRSHRVRLFFAVMAGIALLSVACSDTSQSSSSGTPTSPLVVGPASVPGGTAAPMAKADKVDICHKTESGIYQLINVSGNAEAAHVAHGDARPGEDVPDVVPASVFGPQCEVVAKPTATCGCDGLTAGTVTWAQAGFGSNSTSCAVNGEGKGSSYTDLWGGGLGQFPLLEVLHTSAMKNYLCTVIDASGSANQRNVPFDSAGFAACRAELNAWANACPTP